MPWKQTRGGTQVGLEADVPDNCNLCHKRMINNAYDAKTKNGRWGWLCPNCFAIYGIGLGIGYGQEYQWEPDAADAEHATNVLLALF